jgi:tetratricopeptide (TPR) repeat protein
MQIDEMDGKNFTPGSAPKSRFRLPRNVESPKFVAPPQPAPVAPAPQQPPPPDYSGHFAFVQSKRDDAGAAYMRKDYKTAIGCYTWALQAMYNIKDAPVFEKDVVAVLFSNRSAALLMIGAYTASADDCRTGLEYVSDGGPRGELFSKDSGPPLRVRLLTRFGKALLKQGSDKEAFSSFETAIEASQQAEVFTVNHHTPVEAQQNIEILTQIENEARICKREVRQYQELVERLRQSMEKAHASGDRRAFAEPLGHVKSALAYATGSESLMQSKLMLLSRMQGWREVAGVLERLAAMNARMDGAFVGDLASKNPFPGTFPSTFLSADFFDRAREEDASTADKKLNSKSAGEAVLKMPFAMTSVYVRALRLEERYHAAENVLNALQSLVSRLPDHAQFQFTWTTKEQSKLERTRAGREKGDDFFRKGLFDQASKTYSHTLSIDGEGVADALDAPNVGGRLHAVLFCNRAACLMALKQYGEALNDCTAALRIHPRYMKAMLRRARCYARLVRYAEAISEFKRWLELATEASAGSMPFNARVTPCLFDGPQDVKEQDIVLVRGELDEVIMVKRRAESAAREEASRRHYANEQWKASFASAQSAQQRRDHWYTQPEGPRRWDSFRNRGPRPSNRRSASAEPGKSSPGGQSSERTHRRQNSFGSSSPRSLEKMDHYTVLNVTANSTGHQIKKSYRKLVLLYHPDKNKKEGAKPIFQRIQDAYDILSDPIERHKYDKKL